MKRKIILFLILFQTFIILFTTSDQSYTDSEQTDNPKVYTIAVNDIITAGTADYISRSIRTAENDDAAALVVLINTPGGLVTATLSILEEMLGSSVPIITYVEPSGAIAASAGSFILVGGHIASMTPGTTCGAAMPVTLSFGEEGSQTTSPDDKTLKFLAGHMRSIAAERGKNADIVEKFVTENLTIDSATALEEGVIDIVAPSLQELLEAIHNQSIMVKGKMVQLNTLNATIIPMERILSEKVTGLLGNPQISFLLVILGFYGIVIGVQAPETYLPEVAGVIALVLGLYGIGLFQANVFAGVLMLLGVILLITEFFTPTYGVLSLGGVVCLVVGGIFLPVEPLMPRAWMKGFVSVTIGIGIGASVFLILVVRSLIQIRKKPHFIGKDAFVNHLAEVVECVPDLDSEALIKIQGELWRAKSENGSQLTAGEWVNVVGREGLVILVEPVEDQRSK